jgi:hypothetical protein
MTYIFFVKEYSQEKKSLNLQRLLKQIGHRHLCEK